MRTALGLACLLTGCIDGPSAGPSGGYDDGWGSGYGGGGGYSGYGCTSDSECGGGFVCARSHECLPPASVRVARTLPLEETAEAHRLGEEGGTNGKIVVTLDWQTEDPTPPGLWEKED